MKTHWPRSDCSSGFSNLELLLCLLTAGFVLALHGPLRAREPDLGLVCGENLRQIMRATHQYAADHDGFMPAPNWGTGSEGWILGQSWRGSSGLTGPSAAQLEDVKRGQLWPYLQNHWVFLCPGDSTNALRLLNYYRQREIKVTSYTMNGAMMDSRTSDPFKVEQYNPRSLVYWEPDETIPFNFNDGGTNPANASEGMSLRHTRPELKAAPQPSPPASPGMGCNFASMDGSVEFLTLPQYRSYQAKSPSRLLCAPQ